MIADCLLATEAAKRKITVSALVDAEVNAKVAVVTEAEVDSFVEANKARLKGEGEELREGAGTTAAAGRRGAPASKESSGSITTDCSSARLR